VASVSPVRRGVKGKKKKKKRPQLQKRQAFEEDSVSPDVSPDMRNPFSEPNSGQGIQVKQFDSKSKLSNPSDKIPSVAGS